MNGSSRSATFMKSPLVTWVKTLNDPKCNQKEVIKDYIQLCNGIFLNKVWRQIDPQSVSQNVNLAVEETSNRIKNLNALLNNIRAFYENVLGQILVLKMPDVIKIATNSNDESYSCEDMRVLLLLLLGCAVQCEQKEHFIDRIKQLDISVQHAIVECIQQITDNPESVWLNSEWSIVPDEQHDRQRLYSILVQHINKLVKERDELFQRLVDLSCELNNICPNTSQINSTSISSNEGSSSLLVSNAFGEQKTNFLVELADVKSKLRRVQQELEEKNEILSELKEILEQNKEISNKLRQDNLELIQEARSAKAYRDEIDILNEKVRKVDLLENEVQRYRDKMNELDFFKSRVEELREDNKILSETKVMLEEQLDGSKKRADQMPNLEEQILKLSSYNNELSIQKDLDHNQIKRLLEEIAQLRLDKKTTTDELTKVQTELSSFRSQINIDLLHQNGEGNLLEQINNDALKRVLKLELENQRLLSLMENFKNSKTQMTDSSLNNNNQRYGSRISIDNLSNGNESDEIQSPGDMSITSDSPSVSLATDLNAKEDFYFKITDDCDTQFATNQALKQAYKSLKLEYKTLEDKHQMCITSQEELQRLRDDTERKECLLRNDQLKSENIQLKDENKVLIEEHKRLQTEYKMLQNIYKKLRSENNELKLKQTELQCETAECRDKMSILDVEVSKLSNYCEVVAFTNNSLESHRKSLISNMSNLLSQYHDLLNEISSDSEKLITDKLHDLCAKKEKMEKMIREYDVSVEKKKVAVTAPNVVRRIHKSTTDLCLSTSQTNHSKVRNSAPLDNFVDESIYGRIWEAETPPLPSNTAVLLPIRNISSSTLSNIDIRSENDNHNKNDVLKQDEVKRHEDSTPMSPLCPPPRPPPRVSTTIENKMTISVITSPTLTSPLNNSTLTNSANNTSQNANNRSNTYLHNNFSRGTYKSNSINYGSPIRRQREHQNMKNGHHIHLFHHMHPHSASPSLHSDSSLTPVEDSELSDCTATASNRSRILNNADNVTVNSNTTNSIWYEYGCV